MQAEDNELNLKWNVLLDKLQEAVGKRPADLNAVLFLIGVQELGQGIKQFSKEQKQDLMHIAICKLLSYSGIYEFVGTDEQGWPHWKLVKNLPFLDLLDQEKLLKSLAIDYFEKEV
ncbi:hypothetical protein Q0590_08320 [Rhodocytophaga aerolata]|uniref:Uncharacterized protein n=1 Tax=Rhodocytophaga aerolata TaxID=455078 RepID=A0ABT8R2D3_9BACT|nr:hypothetical protein [Rhodocytophaga aerolata]MDO1446253.1 hypothetical protein [Rhodocytophaga aerolata]